MEHYRVCPVVKDFAHRYFGFDLSAWTHRTLFLCDTAIATPTQLSAGAILVYAVARTIHGVQPGQQLSSADAYDTLETHALRGLDGHSKTRSLMGELFGAQCRRVSRRSG